MFSFLRPFIIRNEGYPNGHKPYYCNVCSVEAVDVFERQHLFAVDPLN